MKYLTEPRILNPALQLKISGAKCRTMEDRGACRIYPNPNSDVFTLKADKEIAMPYDVEIYNAAGKLVLTQQNNRNRINLSHLTHGVYILKGTDTNHQISRVKLMKQ